MASIVSRSSKCKQLGFLSVLLFGVLAANTTLQAAEITPAQSGEDVKIIELYTSHGCSSCPPAEVLLGELLANDDKLLALEFHVDYWNNLIHGRDGNFVDPYSKASYSKRQRDYNVSRLAGRPGVYTPQAVINGTIAAVGSNRRHIGKALKRKAPAAFQIRLRPHETQSSSMHITVSGNEQRRRALRGTDIVLVRYIDSATTQITGGENNRLELHNHHIVTDVQPLGQISAESDMSYTVDVPKEGEGCVVLVQEGARSPIYAALECP